MKRDEARLVSTRQQPTPTPLGRAREAMEVVPTIRERMLTQLRPKDGEFVRVRFEETPDGVFTYVLVSWKYKELLVTQWSVDQPKTYKTVGKALEHARNAYGFKGPFFVGSAAEFAEI